MGDNFQYGDIIFLGLIAVFIALRLRAMLGRNAGTGPHEVWKQPLRDTEKAEKIAVFPDRMRAKPASQEDVVPPALQENKVIADGLKAIKAADASFSTVDFLAGAKLAFEWAVQAFAKGDKEKLRTLLSPERFQQFASDIDTREKSGLALETTLVSILAADITEASLSGSRAQITVQFTTEQMSVTRDKDKNMVSGDPSAIEKVIDVWTFERDAGSRDPNWKITAT
jgi:predicted lipid-binding transport protein (Tim44 family)